MTKHAEVIYEDGSHSIVSFDDESELTAMLQENHRRAVNGEPSAAQDMVPRTDLDPNDPVLRGMTSEAMINQISQRPAFRAKKVLLYGKHPADLVPVGNEGSMPIKVDTVRELVAGMAGDGDTVNMHQLTQAMRDEVSPVYPSSPGKFESHFKMQPASEMSLDFLSDSPSRSEDE